MAAHHTSKEQRKTLADRMKDPDDELRLVIVRDMWLTGFDVPLMLEKLEVVTALSQAFAIAIPHEQAMDVQKLATETVLKQAEMLANELTR